MGERKWTKGMFETEDWWALWIGMFFVLLGIAAAASGIDLTGWIIKFSKWTTFSKSFNASHKDLMGPIAAMVVSYVVFTAVTSVGAVAMKWDLKKYLQAWTIIYVLSVAAYIIGNNAYIGTTSLDRAKYGIDWSLSLGGAYFILALVIGLIIGNLAPKSFRDFMKSAARPEWFIKIAIVALGTKLGLKGLQAAGFATHLLLAGAAATIVAYLLFWPLAYTICRRVFKLKREWAATLASGISICGVSAAIATGASIRARPIVPILISGIIVVFALFELVILPFVLVSTPWFNEPIAAGASLGLTVKTDGADAASGAILDELMRAKAYETSGVTWSEGWILNAAVMTKIWIDMFIGVWAFVLAYVWCKYIDRRPGEKVQKMEIWWRFPKFVIGYFFGMLAVMILGFGGILSLKELEFGLKPIEGALRHFFFVLTFTSIGLITDFRELKKEGLGKLTVAYAVILLIVIIPIGWLVAWLFHHGMVPPT